MSESVTWGVLGAGAIAKAFVHGVSDLSNSRVVAVGSRSAAKAQAFAEETGVTDATCHGSYEALLADDAVDAVYIATPHPMHVRWAIKAAEAGKHILCEKPAGVNRAEAMAMIEAARVNGVFFMEAFKDRCHPQTHKLLELLRDKAVGEVRMVRVAFGFGGGDTIDHPEGRLFNLELAGGGIMDVGCYAAEFARLIAGAAAGQPFLHPVKIKAVGHLGETGVDEWAAATLQFDNGVVAQLGTAIRASLNNACEIVGSTGSITIEDPWLNSRDHAEVGQIVLNLNGQDPSIIEVPADHNSFGYETKVAADAILAGKTEAEAPAMTWADSISQAETLDAWRKEIGLVYPQEKPEGFSAPLNERPAKPIDGHHMTYGQIPGLDRPVSRLVMGCDNQTTFPHAAVMFDDFIQHGGNTFDTAHIYGGGLQEKLLGQWIASRGVRDQVNLISKSGHTPRCTPDQLSHDFLQSLDRLQTDHVEIYIMHRDNPDVPVGEFVDVLSEHADAGRMTVFGGSNWGVERFAAANDYAKANDKHAFTLMSNNFSLARMINPVWTGCIAATEPAIRDYLIENQIPNLAWSSQARGYFVSRQATGRAGRWEHDNAWDSPENRQRRERAFELADKYGVTAINIAAAYVLGQPFPSFALIGPRNLDETATSLPALSIQLSEEEMAYLDLRD
ncbi:MAG: aldo/keto reductase [Planctomycetota bacterium]